MSAEGLTNTEIGRQTGATWPTVISWRNRYATAGIDALVDLPRPGRSPVVNELEGVATTLAHGGPPTTASGSQPVVVPTAGAGTWGFRSPRFESGVSGASSPNVYIRRRPQVQAQAPDLGELYRNISLRVAMLHRPVSASAAERALRGSIQFWLKLVEVSLGIIAQQVIRCGTLASVPLPHRRRGRPHRRLSP
jgi:hypothetical protein